MDNRTTRVFRVRSYEVGAEGTLHHAVILNWCQELAYDGSAERGYPVEAYQAMGAFWVMRSIEVEFLAPIRFGDHIEATTWVSDVGRVRSFREYEVRLAGGELVARGRADWVFMDQKAGTPQRITPEMSAAYAPNGQLALAPFAWPPVPEVSHLSFSSLRHVQRYELDALRHVNNAVYLNWIEQQAYDAWVGWGYDPQVLTLQRHFIEYKRSALPDDDLTLRSNTMQQGGHLVWHHTVQRGDTVLVEARSLSPLHP